MIELHVQPRAIDFKTLKNKAASLKNVREVDESVTVRHFHTGEPLIVSLELEGDQYPSDLLSALQVIRYDTSFRTEGLKTTSRVFGYQPRIPIRRDFCTGTSLAREFPAATNVIFEWAERVTRFYAEHNQARWRKQDDAIKTVKPDWRIPHSAFTSGIVNWNNQLAYHRDAGNFPDLWSCMVVIARDVNGGSLVVPELDLAFKFTRAHLIMFDGAKLIHGVSPISKLNPAAYRYSVVWYALRDLCKCGTPKEELDRIKRVKTEREDKRRTK